MYLEKNPSAALCLDLKKASFRANGNNRRTFELLVV